MSANLVSMLTVRTACMCPRASYARTRLHFRRNVQLLTCGGRRRSPDGSQLIFLSDVRSGWYNIHKYTVATGELGCILPQDLECCSSHQGWHLGLQSFHFLDPDNLVLVYSEKGKSVVAKLNLGTQELTALPLAGQCRPPFLIDAVE